jgi:hypothetical protein
MNKDTPPVIQIVHAELSRFLSTRILLSLRSKEELFLLDFYNQYRFQLERKMNSVQILYNEGLIRIEDLAAAHFASDYLRNRFTVKPSKEDAKPKEELERIIQ